MNGIEDVARFFVEILCKDFEVDVIPNVIHFRPHIGIRGSYYAKVYAITISGLNHRTIIHEFIHHLQYERIGYNYDKYIREWLRESKKPYIFRESEIEARIMTDILYDIYRPVFKKLFRAKPVGRENLCRYLVSRIYYYLRKVDECLKVDIEETIGWHDLMLWDVADFYMRLRYITRYAVRVCFGRWDIPELEELDRYARFIRKLANRYRTLLKKGRKRPETEEEYVNRVVRMYNRLIELHTEFRDMISRVFTEHSIW
jgi:hypothetical protein